MFGDFMSFYFLFPHQFGGHRGITDVDHAERDLVARGFAFAELVDGRFANTLSAVRLLGGILGVGPRAEELASRMEEILGDIDRVSASVPTDKRARVYLARGPRGLETGNRGSINTEIIERAGATNVVDGGVQQGGLYNVSLEQVAVWNPDTIVTVDPSVAEYIRSDPSWSQIEAVRRDRVLLSPRLPYGWIDAPPSLNRLMGLQ